MKKKIILLKFLYNISDCGPLKFGYAPAICYESSKCPKGFRKCSVRKFRKTCIKHYKTTGVCCHKEKGGKGHPCNKKTFKEYFG